MSRDKGAAHVSVVAVMVVFAVVVVAVVLVVVVVVVVDVVVVVAVVEVAVVVERVPRNCSNVLPLPLTKRVLFALTTRETGIRVCPRQKHTPDILGVSKSNEENPAIDSYALGIFFRRVGRRNDKGSCK